MTRVLLLSPLLLALAGCVSFSPDGGMDLVRTSALTKERAETAKIGGEDAEASASERARALLRRPLTADASVRVAFLRNKGLQASYNDLGISEAKFVAASLPPNPAISLLDIRNDVSLDIERRLAVDVLALATLPARQEIAEVAWQGAKLEAAAATLKLAADVRRQYWRAVAARAETRYLTEARAATETIADLTRKLGETGALNKLDQSREFAFYAELSADLAKARTQEKVEKERLTRLLGLWGPDIDYALPTSLPPLPSRPLPVASLETTALAGRVDVAMARGDLDRVAKEYGLTRASRYINALELAAAENVTGAPVTNSAGHTTTEKERLDGVELRLEIPIFDWGEARSREAQETYMRAANRLAEKGVNARSEVREAYTAYRGALDVARLYQGKVLPLRQLIQDNSLLHYNGMLADLFVLLQDGRARILSNMAAIDAHRDFLLADTDLHAALNGAGMAGSDAKPTAMATSPTN
jgi:outer membrane protein TolC